MRRLVEAGHPEIVLTGVDLGHYGADLTPRSSLAALLRAARRRCPGCAGCGCPRMLPAYFTEDVLEILTTAPAIAPHFHVPLQSGSDRVLRRMRRPYTIAMYRRVVERLAAAIPRLGLGADVDRGLPRRDRRRLRGDARPGRGAAVLVPARVPVLRAAGAPRRRGWPERVDARTVAARARRAARAGGRARRCASAEALVGRVEDVLVLETRDRVDRRPDRPHRQLRGGDLPRARSPAAPARARARDGGGRRTACGRGWRTRHEHGRRPSASSAAAGSTSSRA